MPKKKNKGKGEGGGGGGDDDDGGGAASAAIAATTGTSATAVAAGALPWKDGGEEKKVPERVIAKRSTREHGVQYQIRWRDYPDHNDDTWEPLKNLSGSENLVAEFERRAEEDAAARAHTITRRPSAEESDEFVRMAKQKGAEARAREMDQKEALRVDVMLRAVDVLSLLFYVAGLLFVVFCFPKLAHRTYFSENALLVNGAEPAYGASDSAAAQLVLERLQKCHSPGLVSAGEMQSKCGRNAVTVIVSQLVDLGLDTETHDFDMHLTSEASLRRFGRRSSRNAAPNTVRASNIVALLRAPRGDGKEALVLTAEYTDADADEHHIREGDGSVAVLVSLVGMLTRVPWLSKDVIFLATPKSARRHEAVQAWLEDYHSYKSRMIRAGEIWAAIALKLPSNGRSTTPSVCTLTLLVYEALSY